MNTVIPLSQDNYVPSYQVYGTGNTLLQAAAYYDPNAATAAAGGLKQPTIPAQVANTFMNVGLTTNQQTRGKQIGQIGRYGN